MEFYYAVGQERRGPVDAAEFVRLVREGVIRADSLVWRTGMAGWKAYAEVRGVDVPAPPSEGPRSAPVATGGGPLPPAGARPEEFRSRLQAQPVRFSPTGVLAEAWDAYTRRGHFWEGVGVCLVAGILTGAAGSVPIVGTVVAPFVVSAQLTAGMQWWALRVMRGERAEFADVFAGYQRNFGGLALMMLLQVLVYAAAAAVAVGAALAGGAASAISAGDETGFLVGALPGILVGVLAFLFLGVRCTFMFLLVIDQGFTAPDAFALGWRMSGRAFWPLCGLLILIALLSIGGLVLLIVGILFVIPLGTLAIAAAYRDMVDPRPLEL